MPAGSKTDPPLTRVKPINDGSSASVITYIRRGKKWHNGHHSQKRGVRIRERNNNADTKVGEEGGGGAAPDAGSEIHLQPMVKTMVWQVVPLQPMEVNGGGDIHPEACEGPHTTGGCA